MVYHKDKGKERMKTMNTATMLPLRNICYEALRDKGPKEFNSRGIEGTITSCKHLHLRNKNP